MQNPPTQNKGLYITMPRATDLKKVWLHVGTLIDGESDRPLRDAHIVYDSASVFYVAEGNNPPPSAVLNIGQSLPDPDLPDFTLLPSLIEAHAHLFLEGGELEPGKRVAHLKQSRAQLLEAGRRRLEKLIDLGVTGLRDAGDNMGGRACAQQNLFKRSEARHAVCR
jgi:hypothetical protein